jgi:phage baseplate assembly protein gpV
MSDLFIRLVRRIGQLEAAINQLSRQQNNMFREGVVTEVDYASGLAIVDGFGGKSKKIPWLQRAGAIREWNPVTVGERVMMLSPNGDPGRAVILPGGFTDQFPQNHAEGGVKRADIGSSFDQMGASERIIKAQTIILRATVVKIEANVEIVGSSVTHNGTNIGDTHVHGGVLQGGADTNVPH